MLKNVPIDVMLVKPHDVRVIWPLFQRAFRKVQGVALGDSMDEVAIVDAMCDGSVELHVATRGDDVLGGIILQYIERPKGLCCFVVVSLFDALRDVPSWTPVMNAHLAEHARKVRGCYTIEAFARDGAIKPLEKLGWRRKATVMEMI